MSPPTRAIRVTRGMLALCFAVGPSCVPSTYRYVTVPLAIERRPPPGLPTIVDLEIARIEPKLGHSLAEEIVVYHVGRTPLPTRLVDTDGDGEPDVIRVALPAGRRLASAELLVITSPGPAPEGEAPNDPPTPGIRALYEEIRD